MSTTEKRPKTGLIMLLLSITFIVGVVWLFRYTNQKELERKNERINQEVRKLQEEVSTYIIENYEGVETITWRGWGYSPKSDIPGTSMTINITDKAYSGNGIFGYDLYGELDPIKYTEEKLQRSIMKFQEQGIIKSDKGSPDAKVNYNYKERD